MKIYDDVKVIKDRKEYEKEGIHKGDVGYIVLAEIRDSMFMVNFIDKNFETHKDDKQWFEDHYDELQDDIMIPIKIEDLEIVKVNKDITDQDILEELPANNPKWWCKVENGYIINLLGERKNKIPYDYNS